MTKPPLTTNRHAISDEKWQQIEKLFPAYTTGRPPKLSNRAALNARALATQGRLALASRP